MRLLIIASLSLTLLSGSVYNYSVTTVNGNTIKLDDYRNKRILIVNIALSGNETAQITELQQFYQIHKDSILVIAFPSNSFGNTAITNQEIKNYMNSIGVTYPVAQITDVIGVSAHPLYKWLVEDSTNRNYQIEMEEDFQKILIGKDGKIKGAFGAPVKPGNIQLLNAIKYN